MADERRLCVLFVEDNPHDRTLAVRELHRELPNSEVITARDEAEFQRLLQDAAFDAVITDYQLNWTDGLRVLRAVKTRCPGCPVVMFTASGSQEIAVEAMKAGLDDYVVKSPAHYVRLPLALRAALEREEQRQAIRAAEQERERLDAELRRHVAELAERDRRKDEFLAVLGHELRNPLAALSNSLLLLQERGAGDERDARLRERCLRQLRQLTRLVDDLLDAARITRGEVRLERRRVELNRLLQEVEHDFAASLARRQQTLDLELPPEPVTISGDPVRLNQVFSNLLDNASKYSPEGTTIRIELRQGEEQAVVRVHDQGRGIAPASFPLLFDLFSQVGRSPTQDEGGLGIGLHLVQFLVDLHGGSVEVASEGEGCGSTFTVRLPAGEAALPSE